MIEILSEISGVKFQECVKRKKQVIISGIVVPLINIKDLEKNKRASNRYKDLDDLENLGLL